MAWKILHLCRSRIIIRKYKCFATEIKEYKSVVPAFRLVTNWPNKIAITDEFGDYTYANLFVSSKILAGQISEILNGRTQKRVAFICPNNALFILAQWACWMSGQIAVPLCSLHPQEMWEYFVKDSECSIILGSEEYQEKIGLLSKKTDVKSLIVPSKLRISAMVGTLATKSNASPNLKGGCNPNLYTKWKALIIYTSGSTASPKGVVLSFSNLSSQINGMISAWSWNSEDTILHCLPLHHVHGLINGLLTALHCGARCLMLPKFNAKTVWNHLLNTEIGNSRRVTVFTGVPTMYIQLIKEYENSFGENHHMTNYIKAVCSQQIRLMMCGSASLPISIFDTWEQITGHRLLERYGMSETGMTLSNPLNGFRKPGFVGNPMPNVYVRIVDNGKILVEGNEHGTKIVIKDFSVKEQLIGELQVKSENVFKEYWNKPQVTKESFVENGWFLTGDTVQFIDNSYKILGRNSVDIIKSGGFKVSALFIESTLLQHPDIKDVIVVGLPDVTWGQKITAIIVFVDGGNEKHITQLSSIRIWIKDKLPMYMVPMMWKVVSEIPRNAMGKVNKKDLIKQLFEKKNFDNIT